MAGSTLLCSSADLEFGPGVASNCSSFDFTLTFESSILSILPSALFVITTIPRIYLLRRSTRKVGNGLLKSAKLVTILLLNFVNLSLLVLNALWFGRYPLSITSSVLSLVDAIGLLILSNEEHNKSIQPSPLISFYLLISSLCDAVRLRSLWLRGTPNHVIPALSTVELGLKMSMFFLESRSKESSFISKGPASYGPEETSDIFSNGFFVWINRLLVRGFKSILSPSDLFPLPQTLKAEALHDWFKADWKSSKHGEDLVQLAWYIMWFSKRDIAVTVISRLALLAFTLLQPLTMNTLLSWLDTPNTPHNMDYGYGLIAAYGLIYLGIALSTGIFWRYQFRWVTKLRGILISLLYCRVLESNNIGNVKNDAIASMTVDVENFTTGMRQIHEIYANVLQIGFATWMIERQIAIGSLAPIVLAILCGLATYKVSRYIAPYQQKWVQSTQKRLNTMTFMLRYLKEMKFSGLERMSFNVMNGLREAEMVTGGSYRNLSVTILALAYTPTCLSPILSFAIFAATQRGVVNTLDSATLFTTVSLISLITSPLIALFQIIPSIVSAWHSLSRIQSLIKSDNLHEDHRNESNGSLQSPPADALVSIPLQNAFEIQNASIGYSTDSPVLKDISVNIPRSSITAITGPVGCGKSTFMKALLGGTLLPSGGIRVSSDYEGYAYCDQDSWLFSGTIRENIIGYTTINNPTVDSKWYKTTLEACCLEEDLVDLQDGDSTNVGSNGNSLSGGQKQRIALARAVYSRKKLVILDDSFNALDSNTVQKIGDRLFGPHGLWRRDGISVIMVTQNEAILNYVDQIITINASGIVTLSGRSRLLSAQDDVRQDHAKFAQTPTTLPHDSTSSRGRHSKPNNTTPAPSTVAKHSSQSKGSITYLKSIGLLRGVSFLVLLVSQSFFTTFPSLWLKWWLGAITRENGSKVAYYLGLYSLFQVLGLGFVTLAAYHLFRVITPHTGLHFHQKLLKATMSSTMATITHMDAGSVLNRFSQDIRLIDSVLPMNLLNATEGFFNTIAQAILIAVSSLYIFISFPIILGVVVLIQRFYLRTSRRLRLLDLEEKSPLYTHFMESITGLLTIRAFRWQTAYKDKLFDLLDKSQKPFYLLFMVQRWLSVVLDLVTAAIAVLVVGLAVVLRSNSGLTGVALVNVMAITETLQLLIMQWSSLETSLGAISRTEDYARTTEVESTDEKLGSDLRDWPSEGSISFNRVSVRHTPDKPEVLRDITMKIPPGAKVGIFGRSGSGKSSLISNLFGMAEITHGSIVVDGIDISQVSPLRLRSSIIGLPQQDYIIPGLSLRENLCPTYHEHHQEGKGKPEDEHIIHTLKLISLWNKIRSFHPDATSDRVVLDMPLSSDSNNNMVLSPGQMRLLCLVRAILRVRPGSIVVFDEPMSVMDPELRTHIRQLFNARDGPFGQCTVLMIQHHIDTLLDYDLALFLDNGRICEMGDPRELLKHENGGLRKLWDDNVRIERAD